MWEERPEAAPLTAHLAAASNLKEMVYFPASCATGEGEGQKGHSGTGTARETHVVPGTGHK